MVGVDGLLSPVHFVVGGDSVEGLTRSPMITKTLRIWVHSYDVVIFEDLKIENMTKSVTQTRAKAGKNVRAKSGLNASILGQVGVTCLQHLTDSATNAAVGVEIRRFLLTCPQTRA
jgi:hypothetical protein